MSRVLLLSLMTAGLYGCAACYGDLPTNNKNDDDDNTDTAVEDTAVEDTGPVDTGPPPPCAVPEEEPNNSVTDAQKLPLERWACGVLLEQGDLDYFYFDVPTAGWYRVWVRGQDIGSSSDLQLAFSNTTSTYTALATTSPNSLDPQIVFYAEGADRFQVSVADTFYGYGDDYIWEMMATESKEPVDWNVVEDEWVGSGGSNDALVDGEPVEDGDQILGVLNPGSDQDFYIIDLPAGDVSLVAQVHAWNYGSPLYSTLRVFDMDGTELRERSYGGSGLDYDPKLTYKTTGPVQLAVQVDVQNNAGGGGLSHWYMLELAVEDTASE